MYSFSVIGIRLLAAYFIFSGLGNSGYVLLPLFEPQYFDDYSYFYTSLWVLTNLVFGVLIFFLARPFSQLLISGLPDIEIKKGEVHVVSVGTFLIGLYFFVVYFPDALVQTLFTDSYITTDSVWPETGDRIESIILSYWVPVFVSVIIMLGANHSAKLFSKLRKL